MSLFHHERIPVGPLQRQARPPGHGLERVLGHVEGNVHLRGEPDAILDDVRVELFDSVVIDTFAVLLPFLQHPVQAGDYARW